MVFPSGDRVIGIAARQIEQIYLYKSRSHDIMLKNCFVTGGPRGINQEGSMGMKEKGFHAINRRKAVVWLLLLLSAAASLTKAFTGFDIDEAYALAMPYRMLQSDRLFADMWEVHQTSSFLPYCFLKLYEAATGSMDGVVLYIRVVATFLHLAVTLVVYRFLKKSRLFAGKLAVIGALIYYNFLPKWMISLDFSMQQLWFFTLFLVFLFQGLSIVSGRERKADGKKGRRVFLLFMAGLMLALDVLAYPGMILVYPAVILLLLFTGRKKDALCLTGGCFAAAAVFLCYVFCYLSPGELWEAVSHIFMDGSHQYDLATKLGLYASQWGEALVQAGILLAPSAVLAWILQRIARKADPGRMYGKLPYDLLLCLSFEILVSGWIVFAGLFVTWGPFRLQVRYIVQFAMAFYLWKRLRRTPRGWTMWTLFLSLAAFLGVLIASNVGPVSSSSYLVIGNLVFAGLTFAAAKRCGRGMKTLAGAGAVLFLLSLILCKGYYMRNTEYVPGDISDSLAKVEEGPLAGIYVPQEDFDRYTDDYQVIRSQTTKEDRVLFMGTDALCNLYANGTLVTPTTISTPAFNSQWVEYFEMYPEKQPTVIFLAKNTVDDREKFFEKNEFGIWIAERYDVEYMEETDSLCILRLRED